MDCNIFLKCHMTPMTSSMTSKASYFKDMVSNSGCSCARVMIFFLFSRFFRSKKSFQLLPIA